jgi:hypothetical protein
MCTCKAAAKKSNEYVSGKKYIKYSRDNARYINQQGFKGRKELKKIEKTLK